MCDPADFAVGVKARLAFSYAPELTAVVGEDLSWLSVLTDGPIQEPDHVLCGVVSEYLAASYVALCSSRIVMSHLASTSLRSHC